MKQLEIEMLQRDEPELYALAIEMERLYRSGPHFRGDNFWTVRAKHKVTREVVELSVQAVSPADARQQFRSTHNDQHKPYVWQVDASQAVPGLGRSFAWASL